MDSSKVTNILLIVLILLLCLHVGLEILRPTGRYVRWSAGSSAAVLDTSTGTVYLEDGSLGQIVNIVRVAKQFQKHKAPEPAAPTGEPPDETHRP